MKFDGGLLDNRPTVISGAAPEVGATVGVYALTTKMDTLWPTCVMILGLYCIWVIGLHAIKGEVMR